MDLNNIDLPASVIADLYHSSLISMDPAPGQKSKVTKPKEPVTQPVAGNTTTVPWKSLGGNHKNVMVITSNHEAVHLPDNELDLLTGILSACKLTLEDVAIVNLNNHPGASYKDLTSFFKSRIVLLFDVEPASFGLPMSFPQYQIQAFAGNSFLYSPSLKDLGKDKVEKSKLWVSLKRLFNL